ncbi:hypothetical protein [Streptomyces sp. NPDC001678]|uniref:hypothetical protein n=1 Tax=Streptomyces sp. NPDC001678 TaxID=3364599 RepID=UPI0036963343
MHHEQLEAELAALQDKLASVQAGLTKAQDARDQLADALEELLADVPSPTRRAAQAPEEPDSSPGRETGLASRLAESGRSGTTTSGGRRGSSREGAKQKRTQTSGLMRAIVQVLVTAGRPMKPKEIAEALGRPTKGKEGDSARETIRGSCKRLVTAGQLVRVSAGEFVIRQAAHSQEPLAEGGA